MCNVCQQVDCPFSLVYLQGLQYKKSLYLKSFFSFSLPNTYLYLSSDKPQKKVRILLIYNI